MGWGGNNATLKKRQKNELKIKDLENYLHTTTLGSALPKAASSTPYVSWLLNWYTKQVVNHFPSTFGSCTSMRKRAYETSGAFSKKSVYTIVISADYKYFGFKKEH